MKTWALRVAGATALALAVAGCGGGGSATLPTQSDPALRPSPTPAPTPAPTPTPEPSPTPNPVVKVTIKVLGVSCGGVPVPGSENDRAIPVGCKATIDLNAKDSNNKLTTPLRPPEWTYRGDRGAVVIAEDEYTPILNVRGVGGLTVSAVVDEVPSNVLDLVFFER